MFVDLIREFLGIAPELCVQNEYVFAGILFLIIFVSFVLFLYTFFFFVFGIFKRLFGL